MPEAMDIECPCCGAALKVDAETSSVIAVRKKQGPAKSFDELVDRVRDQKSQLDGKFARSVQQSRNQKEILEKKFEEARKRAAQTPNEKPPNPFDYD